MEEGLTKIILLIRFPELAPKIPILPSIRSLEVKCYMTDIVVECVSDASDYTRSTTPQLSVGLTHDLNRQEESLSFEKISSSEWKYHRIIELIDEATIKLQLDGIRTIGSVIIGKSDVERFKLIAVPTETVCDFLTADQNDIAKFRLRFQIISIPLDGSYSEETFRYAMNRDSERIFDMVQNIPDGVASKPVILRECAAHLLQSFKKTQARNEIYTCVLANVLVLQLTLAEPNALVNFGQKPTGPTVQFLDGFTVSSIESPHSKESVYDIDQKLTSSGVLDEDQAEIDLRLAFHLDALGVSLGICFEYFGVMTDITRGLLFQRKAVQLIPNGHAEMPTYLCSLGTSLRRLFSRTRDLRTISEAISFQRQAIQLTQESHSSMPTYISELGTSFRYQFSRTGELTDIDEAIAFQKNAIQLTSKTDTSIPAFLFELGVSLLHRFTHTEELANISEAISSIEKAVELTAEGHLTLPTYLAELGTALRRRFSCTSELGDISRAISFLQDTVQLTGDDHPLKYTYLFSLGTSLRLRFLHTEEVTDISKAITFLRKGVQLTPDTGMPTCLSELVTSLLHRFSRTGELTDISEAISLQKKAVQHLPTSVGYAMPIYLADLANLLQFRFPQTGEHTSSSGAVSFEEKVVQIATNGYSDIAQFLSLLALSLSHRLDHTEDTNRIYLAISKHYFSAESTSGSHSDRFNAVTALSNKNWVGFSPRYTPSELLSTHQAAVHLISQVSGLERMFEKRRNSLTDISTVSASAAALAFASGDHDMALEWLEQGRCLVWSQVNNISDIAPLETIRSYDPDIANKIMQVSLALENMGSQRGSPTSIAEAKVLRKSTLQGEVVAHIKLARQWDQLLTKVRSIPGFTNFLRAPSTTTLLRWLPTSGIVVVINVHHDRCDALALRSGNEPLHISLSEFSYSKAESLRNSLKDHLQVSGVRMRESRPDSEVTRGMRYEGTSLTRILSTLWITVVKPILNGLGYDEPPSDLLRIWWCATGPLAFLPIHAAGIYDGLTPEITSNLSHFAISSYAPTVRALVDIIKTPQEVEKGKSGLFMISQPNTPNLPPIPGTTMEVRRVEQQLSLDSAAATVDRSLANMKSYSCIHFACHAKQDTEKPLKSGFALYDGQLALSSIIQQRLVGADFAFLSACQTGAGDEKLSEEAVHLAAAILAAGYRGAVATMWSIEDRYGPKIADDFYLNLTQDSEGLSGEYAARALHHSVQNLRKSLGNSESALLSWVPYVHFGL